MSGAFPLRPFGELGRFGGLGGLQRLLHPCNGHSLRALDNRGGLGNNENMNSLPSIVEQARRRRACAPTLAGCDAAPAGGIIKELPCRN